MKNLVKVSCAAGLAIAAFSANAKAQTVEVNALGSSGIFLELGLGANYSKGPINAPCVWSESSKNVVATDTSAGSSLTDSGNAWVAWTTGTGGTCSAPTSSAQVYAYLQTDSTVGNRCLANAQLSSGPKCSISYAAASGTAPAGLILGTAGEVSLPASIANVLDAAKVNAAGTDIRPEDAEFATARALVACDTPVVSGSQYLGLGYTNGSKITSEFSTSSFNVINFTLPSSFTVTPVGATPILFVVNGASDATALNKEASNVTSQQLAFFLDGTYSYSEQAAKTPVAAGDPVKVLIREPLSGTYNTVEYNVPNTTVLQTSQDVGKKQPSAQINCSGHVAINPLNKATTSGGARQRAIGTGQELSEVLALPNSLGYGFWSVANFAGFTGTAAQFTKYLEVDGVDPLNKSGVAYTGVVPTTGSSQLANVNLFNVSNGSYPAWSLLRLVNVGSTAPAAVTNLASAAGAFVSFGTTTSRPDFIVPSSLTVVRSHFIPPAGLGEPKTAANGHVGARSSACTAPEAGGDVGGVVYTLTADSAYCTANKVTTGHTGQRR